MQNKIYFSSLNSLRFIAASLVIISHIEQFKFLLGLPGFWHTSAFIDVIGKLGVILFFTLSGFLITYLLLFEKMVSSTIEIKSFYIRRVLRIWPLYFLIVGLSFFLLSRIDFFSIGGGGGGGYASLQDQFFTKLTLFVFFLPNLALILFPPITYAAQLWSIGVEEQFYLLWPVLVKKTKNPFKMLCGVIFLYLLVEYSLIAYNYFFPNEFILTLIKFLNILSIDCMAIGGLFAWLLFNKQLNMQARILLFVRNKYLQIAIYLLTLILIGNGIKFPLMHFEIYSFFFGLIIINLVCTETSIFNLENTVFNYLGKISYGLYMFHPIAIVIVIKLSILNGIINNLIIYTLSIGLTIALAACVYELYEKKFLKLKIKYSKVISGDAVKEL